MGDCKTEGQHNEFKRRHKEYVTLVHLSDLHYGLSMRGSTEAFNQDLTGGTHAKIVEEIQKYEPDVICVTGDIFDNAWRSALKDLSGFAWRAINRLGGRLIGSSVDAKTPSLAVFPRASGNWLEARDALEAMGKHANQRRSALLCVIPGNHDYRIQGFLEMSKWVSRTLVKTFQEVFGDHSFVSQGNPSQLRKDRDFIHLHGSQIDIRVLGVDSNRYENFLNAATGTLDDDQLRQIESEFSPPAKKQDNVASTHSEDTPEAVANPSEFRILLVHHHPLSAAGAELGATSNAVAISGLRRIGQYFQGLRRALLGEQGGVFLRAGGFLRSARRARVDLVLHGHQHHPQITVLRSPNRVDTDHPMMIVGGGSLGEKTDGKYRYNVIRLFPNGNIQVFEIERDANSEYASLVENQPKAELYRDESYRFAQANWMLSTLKRDAAGGGAHFGIACASQCVRRISIREDGSTDYEIEIWGLRATDTNVDRVPIIAPILEHSVVDDPVIAWFNDGSHSGATAHVETELATQGSCVRDATDERWSLVFDQPLKRTSLVALKVTYSIDNNFDFVTEFARERKRTPTKPGGYDTPLNHEYADYKSQRLRMDRLIIAVSFPAKFRPYPQSPPELVVLNQHDRRDPSEEDYARKSLYADASGLNASLTINTPLPGYEYRIEWKLRDRATFELETFDPDALERALAYEMTDITDRAFQEEITGSLNVLKTNYLEVSNDDQQGRGLTLPDDLSMSLFLSRSETRDDQQGKRETAFVERVICGVNGQGARRVRWNAGEGVVGKVHRSGEQQYVSATTKMRGYLVRVGRPHTAIWGIPLRVPMETPTELPSPIFAILCIDTRADIRYCKALNGWAKQMQTHFDLFAKTLSEALIEARQRSLK